jgi:hypothetical protein
MEAGFDFLSSENGYSFSSLLFSSLLFSSLLYLSPLSSLSFLFFILLCFPSIFIINNEKLRYSEFTHPNDVSMVQWMNASVKYIEDEYGKKMYIKV